MWKDLKVVDEHGKSSKKIWATVAEDGTSIIIDMPAMTTPFSEGVELVQGLEQNRDTKDKEDMELKAAEHRLNKYRKQMTWYLPKGMTVNNRFLNGCDEDDLSFNLKTSFRMLGLETKHKTDKDEALPQFPCWVQWKVIVNPDKKQSLKTAEDTDSDDDDKAAWERMSRLGLA